MLQMLNLENTYNNKPKDVQYQTSSNFYHHNKDKDILKESHNVHTDDIVQNNKKENVFSKSKNNFHNKIESNMSGEHMENDEKIEDPHAPKM